MILNSKEYEFNSRVYRRAISRLKLDIEFFLEEAGPIHLVSIEDRLKKYESALEKSLKMDIPIMELDDIGGIRIIVGTISEQNIFCHFFRHGPRGTNYEILKDSIISRENGYRAHHFVLKIPSDYTGTWDECKIEIQIQTIFQNAFNLLSRTWVYKQEKKLGKEWNKKFKQLSIKLAELDRMANDLDVAFNHSYIGNADDMPITPLSFQSIVKEVFNEECDDDSSMWYSLYYKRAGFENCHQMRTFFQNKEVEKVFQVYKNLRRKEENPLAGFAKTRLQFWHFCKGRPEETLKLLERMNTPKKE